MSTFADCTESNSTESSGRTSAYEITALLRHEFHCAVTATAQATVVVAPVVIRAAMVPATDGAAFGATVNIRRVLPCLIGNATYATCHVCLSFR